ncbi:hypothetical protein [Streptomyces similanensis]|uniref:Translation initiation factor IF-2 n=1 Tax=Streptomyces similanensis TaxID=1274988 RepID=A0ABP9L5Y7_9ACTN
MTAEREPRDGVDPLLAAILDEPPRPAPDDPAYLPEYRAARADLATLRTQLHLLADALTEPGTEPGAELGTEPGADPAPRSAPGGPARRPRRSPGRARRARTAVLGGLVAAGVAATLLGFGWLAVQGGAGDGAASSSDKASGGEADSGKARSRETGAGEGAGAAEAFADPGYLACARLVAEGDVTRVAPQDGTARARVTLRVTRLYKADRPVKEAVVTLTGPLGFGTGDHVLVGVPRTAAEADVWLTGERVIAPQRDRIARALPESRAMTCD